MRIFIWIFICVLLAGCSNNIKAPEEVLPQTNNADNDIVEKPETIVENSVENEEISLQYIGNKNSKKFHTSNCATLPDEENRILFDTKDDAVNSGYESCKKCKP